MAIVATLLEASNDITDASTYTTGTLTPSGTSDPLFACWMICKSTLPNTPATMVGNSVTWTLIGSHTSNWNTIASPTKKILIYQGIGTATTGTLVAGFSGVNQIGALWVVGQIAGLNTTTPVVQDVQNQVDAGTSLTCTLASFGSANNGALAAFGVNNVAALNLGSGWTNLGNTTFAAPNARLRVEWRADNDTTADMTFASADVGGFAIELAAPTAATSTLVGLSRGFSRSLGRSMRGNR